MKGPRAAALSAEPLGVGHLVHCYLNTTENWCYRLLYHLPDVQQMIITTNLKQEQNFPLPNARFEAAPLAHLAAREQGKVASAATHRLQHALMPFWRLLLTCKARRLKVLHAHFSFIGWEYLWLSRRLSLPLVVSFYGVDYEWIPRNRPEWVGRYRTLFREAAAFLTEGEFGRQKLISMGCPPGKVHVVHLGIEPASVPNHRRKKSQGSLKLLQMATFTGKKGYESTVRAFAIALQRCPSMTLTLVGKDPEGLRPEIEKLIETLDMTGKVAILDGVPFQSLYSFFAGFDVFIHPSCYSPTGDCEGGAPVVLLDAQATGMPVIASTHCDIPEEVLHGETGLLAPEGDVEQLAAHIRRFYLMDEAEYRSFSANARSHVEREYDITRSAARLRGIYRGLAHP